MKREYREWLQNQGYDHGTISAQLHRVGRVEKHYGDVDEHYEKDRCDVLIRALSYSMEDKRHNRPNPSKIPFEGDIRNNLASYKSSIFWYARFRQTGDTAPKTPSAAGGADLLASRSIVVPRRAAPKPVWEPRSGARTLTDFNLDGRAALEAIIAGSQYRTIAQAVASLTLFSHPTTVRQTDGKALFPAIRNPRRVGEIDEHGGRRVLLDDNRSPTDAFLWANRINRRGSDTQFNHIYTDSLNLDVYTALPNICMTPAFIAKLTDTSEEVGRLLKYRTYQLYGWVPMGHAPPERPTEYETLEWAAPLPAVDDVRAALELAMCSKPKNRTVMAARELGWLFG